MMKLTDKAGQFYVSNSYSEGGFGYIRNNIRGFNNAAKGCPFFILTDLDNTDCAPTLINNWIKEPLHNNLIFRVAVREVEAWLLADIEGFSKYTGISEVNLPIASEEIQDPKAELMRLIRRCRKRHIREDILPKDQYAKVGPNYNERLMEFVNKYWSINRAAKRSDSLKRAIHHLSTFTAIYN
ncbi:MAG: DUF4276 family protein [Nitrospirae bacterium]|nr:DUF4276 family protein [Nitrospirota bacterium]